MRDPSNSSQEEQPIAAQKKNKKKIEKDKLERLTAEEKLEYRRWKKSYDKELRSYLDDVTVEYEKKKGKKGPAREDESSSEGEVCSILSSILQRERGICPNQHHRSLNLKMNAVAIKASLLKE